MGLQTLAVLNETKQWRLWRAEDDQLHERCLVKELTPEGSKQESFARRLRAEGVFLKQHSHPRLLAVRNIDEAAPAVYFEDCQGTVEECIAQNGALPNDLVASAMLQAVDALNHLHAMGYAVGSLSSKTTFVDAAGELKLGDFLGYRFQEENPTVDRRAKYQAPEILDTDFGRPGPSSDLYCLGFLALEMLAGPAFPELFGFKRERGQTPKWLAWHADVRSRLSGWRSRLPAVADSLADCIDGMIAKRQSERQFASARELDVRLKDLGLHGRRVFPMIRIGGAEAAEAAPASAPVARKVGPTLILTTGSKADRKVYRFAPTDAPLVSRVKGAPIVVDDPLVSQRHALLACQGRNWHMYDLYSTSGVMHNRKKVRISGPLRRGDELAFGGASFQVDLELAGTEIIRDFDFLSRIHAGEGGELYRAMWRPKQRQPTPVALRLYPREFQFDQEQIRRFLRGIPAAGKLRRPNIGHLYKGGMYRREDDVHWYLAMEYLSGGSLRDRLAARKGPLLLHEVRGFAHHIAQAIREAERFQLVHRNINPSCILFDGNGTAKLGDFSLLRGVVVETLHDITRGRLQHAEFHYQAPEVLLGQKELDSACDYFSLGAVMYEACTGCLPFRGEMKLVDMVTKLSAAEWPSPRQYAPMLPEQWDRFLMRALARDPAARFASAKDFQQAIVELPI